MKRSGSTLIIVLLIITTLTALVTTVWRSTMNTLDLALQRVRYEQQLWAAEALRGYGVAYVRTHIEKLLSDTVELVVFTDGWPSSLFEEFRGKLIISPHDNAIALTAQLVQGATEKVLMRCRCNPIIEGEGGDGTMQVDGTFITDGTESSDQVAAHDTNTNNADTGVLGQSVQTDTDDTGNVGDQGAMEEGETMAHAAVEKNYKIVGLSISDWSINEEV